ncbi:MAG: PEP-CTERM sorting domain-containing protein [Verrucomicrobiota bacterium]
MKIRSLPIRKRYRLFISGALFIGVVFLASPAFAQLSTAEKADIGFTSLQTRLGVLMPTGAGVSVSQTEAPDGSSNYRPDTSLFSGKTFAFPSLGTTGTSSHASTVGQYLYGANSLAASIGATANSDTVTVYEVNNWLQSGFLNYNLASALPLVESNDIQNHSWIGTTGNSTTDTQILGRMDYAIARDDFVAVFGLNNGSGTTLPNLMGQSYNGMTVGLSNGNHSRGTTTIDGTGRTKPDIVVPTSATSWAAATVSSAAGLVLGVARATPALSNAQTSEMVKALLLAGATKTESEFSGTWTHSSTQPLDAVYGAGELNVENSYDILTAGEYTASPSALAEKTGWDFGTASASSPNYFFFDLTSGQTNVSFTAVLTWNATVTATDTQPGPSVNYSFATIVPNLDLRLYNASGFTIGSLLESSVSTVDNTELIYRTGMSPGRYALALSSNTTGIDYGLAWISVIPEPGTISLLIIGGLGIGFQTFRRGRRH